MPTKISPPDATELFAELSQLADGCCSPQQEAVLLDRLSHDSHAQQLWEEIITTRSLLEGGLVAADLQVDVSAAVLAEVAPLVLEGSDDAIRWLTNAVVDGHANDEQVAGLHRLVSTGHSEGVNAQLASAQPMAAMRANLASDALAPAVLAATTVVDREREALMQQLDGLASTAVVHADVFAWAAVGDALQTAVRSPHHQADAARAGQAALQVIATLAPSSPRAPVAVAPVTTPSWWSRLMGGKGIRWAGAGLATAGAAALVVVSMGGPGEPGKLDLDGEAERILAQLPTATEVTTLALLDDNSADVEAIDGGTTTLVYSTAASNVTVIWVSDDDDEAQGT